MPTLLIAGLTLLVSADPPVDAAVLRAQVGYSHLFRIGDPDLDPVRMHGIGVDLFGGVELGSLGLVPEIQVGVHLFPSHRRVQGFDVETLWTVTPVLAGVRYQLALPGLPVRPHAAAHLGIVYQAWRRTLLGVSGTGSGLDFGFNAGVGADWLVTDSLGVGASLWYWMAASKTDEVEGSGNGHLLTAAAQVTLSL